MSFLKNFYRNDYCRFKSFLGGFLAIGSVVFAWLVLEKLMGMTPCPLCMVQRFTLIFTGVMFIAVGVFDNQKIIRRIFTSLMVIGVIATMVTAVRHLWIIYGPKEESAFSSCGADVHYMMENFPFHEFLNWAFKGTAECGVDEPLLLGIPIPAYTLLLSFALLWFPVLNTIVRRIKRIFG